MSKLTEDVEEIEEKEITNKWGNPARVVKPSDGIRKPWKDPNYFKPVKFEKCLIMGDRGGLYIGWYQGRGKWYTPLRPALKDKDVKFWAYVPRPMPEGIKGF